LNTLARRLTGLAALVWAREEKLVKLGKNSMYTCVYMYNSFKGGSNIK